MLAFVLSAAVTASSAAAPSPDASNRGAQVRASATVTILRSGTASESAGPEELVRRVSRHSDGTVTIIFE